MSASLIIGHLILLAAIFGFVAGLNDFNVLFGNLSWLDVAIVALGLYVVPALVERFSQRRDCATSDS